VTKRLLTISQDQAWLDIVSYGRRGPGQRGRLGSANYEAIARTTGNIPEVMVKVTGGGRNIRQVRDEIDYFGRNGTLEIETDDGERLIGEGIPKQLIDEWNLELERLRGASPYSSKPGRKAPRIVYNLMFSMPAGTPPQKVLAAVKKFAFEKFALAHRYAMVLHTDQKHPHVHLLLKARSEEGVRLHITKPVLREWRQAFARYLRELGVAANATDRKSRGQTRPRKKDGIYRAHLRGESTHMRARAERVAADLLHGKLTPETARAKLLKTREEVRRGWKAISEQLIVEGQPRLAEDVSRFAAALPPVRTERELIAAALVARAGRLRNQDQSKTR